MKGIIQIAVTLLISSNSYSQANSQLDGNWDGGRAFDGASQDSILMFTFDDSKFSFNYGPNHYSNYNTYEVNGDTLILIKDDGFQEAAFLIKTLNDSLLEIQAINWTAVYVTNTLCSPYHAEPPNIPLNKEFDTENILNNDVVRTRLSFTRIIKN